MDEVAPAIDTQHAYRVGPRCGGGKPRNLLLRETQEGPGGGPACDFSGGKASDVLCRYFGWLLGQGLTAIFPAAAEMRRRPPRTRPPLLLSLVVVHDAALHPARDRDHLAGDVTGERVRREVDDGAGDIV